MVESAAELYVQAIAMEREAARRYAELSRRMEHEGNADVARLFARLAAQESEHLAALRRRSAGVELPALEADYSWRGGGASTPHQALGIALRAEKGAKAFFEQAQRVAEDPGLRALAREMVAEEAEHIAMIEALLARTSEAMVDWAALYDAR